METLDLDSRSGPATRTAGSSGLRSAGKKRPGREVGDLLGTLGLTLRDARGWGSPAEGVEFFLLRPRLFQGEEPHWRRRELALCRDGHMWWRGARVLLAPNKL